MYAASEHSDEQYFWFLQHERQITTRFEQRAQQNSTAGSEVDSRGDNGSMDSVYIVMTGPTTDRSSRWTMGPANRGKWPLSKPALPLSIQFCFYDSLEQTMIPLRAVQIRKVGGFGVR